MVQAELSRTCGQLILGGFEAETLSARYRRALQLGERAGAILFKRNLLDPGQIFALTQDIRRTSAHRGLIAIDQEGGRVARLGPPFPKLPPMNVLGALKDTDLTHRLGRAVGRALRSLGFNLNFAPVLDVHTHSDNPIIGDRAFGSDPATVALHGGAFAEGLQSAGVAACGKHFPGHGDTRQDSHLERPVVQQERPRLEAVELMPFREVAKSSLASIMTAHIMVPALDPSDIATLSARILGHLLRKEMGFTGVVVADDLEMRSVTSVRSIPDAAVAAIQAGCDLLLICRDEDAQTAAHAELVRTAERDSNFRMRCLDAAARVSKMARAFPLPDIAFAFEETVASAEVQSPMAELATRSEWRA